MKGWHRASGRHRVAGTGGISKASARSDGLRQGRGEGGNVVGLKDVAKEVRIAWGAPKQRKRSQDSEANDVKYTLMKTWQRDAHQHDLPIKPVTKQGR